jgi:1-acyl-sn-glycerol-3-phosphate acyltransferase
MVLVHLFAVLIFVIIYFLISYFLVLLPGLLLKALGFSRTGEHYMRVQGQILARSIVTALGGRIEIIGREHLPAAQRICIVANHRSLVDIPLIVGYIPIPMGFIAKKELLRIPILHTWMKVLGCIMIDRSNPRSQVRAILDGAKAISAGRPLLIFPEGTRSRSESFGRFKPGSIKLATRSQAVIVPITIRNSSRLFEAKRGVSRQTVQLIIHPSLPTEGLDEAELKALPERVFAAVREEGSGM